MISKLSLLTTVLLIAGHFIYALGTAVILTRSELDLLKQNESLEKRNMIPFIEANKANTSKVVENYKDFMNPLIKNLQFFRKNCGETYDDRAWKSHVDALTYFKAHVLVTLNSLDSVVGTDTESPWRDFRAAVVQDLVSCRLSAAVRLVEVLSSLSDEFANLKNSLETGSSVPEIDAAIRNSQKVFDMANKLHDIAALDAHWTRAYTDSTILPQKYYIWLLVNRMKLESLSASLYECLLELEKKTTESKDFEAEYDSSTYKPVILIIQERYWLTKKILEMTVKCRLGRSDHEISNKFKLLPLDPQVKLPDFLPLVKTVCLKDSSVAIFEVCCAGLEQFIANCYGTLDCDTKRARLDQIILQFDGCENEPFESQYLPLLQRLRDQVELTKDAKAQKRDGAWRLNVWHGMAAVCVVAMVGLGVYCLFFL